MAESELEACRQYLRRALQPTKSHVHSHPVVLGILVRSQPNAGRHAQEHRPTLISPLVLPAASHRLTTRLPCNCRTACNPRQFGTTRQTACWEIINSSLTEKAQLTELKTTFVWSGIHSGISPLDWRRVDWTTRRPASPAHLAAFFTIRPHPPLRLRAAAATADASTNQPLLTSRTGRLLEHASKRSAPTPDRQNPPFGARQAPLPSRSLVSSIATTVVHCLRRRFYHINPAGALEPRIQNNESHQQSSNKPVLFCPPSPSTSNLPNRSSAGSELPQRRHPPTSLPNWAALLGLVDRPDLRRCSTEQSSQLRRPKFHRTRG